MIVNIIYWIVTSLFFIIYWTQVGSWIDDGVELYGILGAGIAANGAFIANVIWTIITKNDKYKFNHGGKDMPFIATIKQIFGIK
jgi:hypothetical protein